MTTTRNYDLVNPRVVCNDQARDTWEVQAKADDGKWWTISDSATMAREEAEEFAADTRAGAIDPDNDGYSDEARD